jgi:hypothetical protein
MSMRKDIFMQLPFSVGSLASRWRTTDEILAILNDELSAPNPQIPVLCKQLAKVSKERTDANTRIAELEYCLQWLARGKFINGLGDGHDMAQRVISKARQGLKGDQDGR